MHLLWHACCSAAESHAGSQHYLQDDLTQQDDAEKLVGEHPCEHIWLIIDLPGIHL